MNVPLQSLSATPAALTVELDIDLIRSGQRPPAPLSRERAGPLADAIAGDLARILGEQVHACGLIVPAALYDLPELLRPGLPWVETLLELYRGSLAGTGFVPQVIGLGGAEGFPISALQPLRRPGSGPLLVVPLLLVGEREAIDQVQQRLETVLLERGRAGIETEQSIRRGFGIEPVNLAYATFNDLSALLKIQLGHAGLDTLWQLLEGALFRPQQPEEVRLPEGNAFVVRGSDVFTLFYSFDRWTTTGAGDLAGYREWLRKQRLYEAGLAAHGLTVRRLRDQAGLRAGCGGHLSQLARDYEIPGEILREPADAAPQFDDASVVLLTEHATQELGPVAYTALVQAADGRILHMSNEYPLTMDAARAIPERWAQTADDLGLVLHLARPGDIIVGEDGQHLMPQVEFGDGSH